MKFGLTASMGILILFAACIPAAWAGDAGGTLARGFSPLEQWKNAVIKHDTTALKALYDPAARISTPKGEIDADADVAFWIGLDARRLKVDVAQSTTPQPGQQQLVLTMEIYPHAASGVRYVSEAEIWQQSGGQWRLAGGKRSDAARLQQPLVVSNDIYSPGSDAHAHIKDAIAKASAQHKRVIIVFGANWCYDCHVLDTAFHRPDFQAVLEKNYEVVHVDIGRGDANQDLMQAYQVPMKKGIPGLAVLDSHGTLLYSQQNGEFNNARAMGPEDLLAFLNKWKPPAR